MSPLGTPVSVPFDLGTGGLRWGPVAPGSQPIMGALGVRDPPRVFTLWGPPSGALASFGGRDVSVGDMSLRWGDDAS